MACPKCKKPIIEEDWRFCPHCGFARPEQALAQGRVENDQEAGKPARRLIEHLEAEDEAQPLSLRKEEKTAEEEEEDRQDPLHPEAETPGQVPRLVYEPDSPTAILSDISRRAPTNIVSFTSEPVGAHVLINGERRGRTPLEMVLDAGVYNIEVTAPSYLPFRGRLRYKAQNSFMHHVKLEPYPQYRLPPGLRPLGDPRDKTTGLPLRVTREIDGAEMVFVPNTSFAMGLKKGNADEQPAHVVKTNAYYIDRYPVRNDEFLKYVQSSGTQMRPRLWKSHLYNQPNQPVVGVNWYQAREYCLWMGATLPTEAQWEKAARAPDGRLWPWGNTLPNSDICCYGGSKNTEGPEPVDRYPKNVSPYGAEQMSGNIFEWCEDWYDASYYRGSPAEDPKGPETGTEKLVRGGSWFTHPLLTRTTARAHRPPEYLGNDCGFRCVVPCISPEEPDGKKGGK